MWQAWTTGILGIWLAIAAFLNFSPAGNMWDNLLVGIVVAYAGFAMTKVKAWQGWTAGILGLWLIVAAFIPALQAHTGNLWNDLIVGVVLIIVGFAALGKSEKAGTHTEAHAH